MKQASIVGIALLSPGIAAVMVTAEICGKIKDIHLLNASSSCNTLNNPRYEPATEVHRTQKAVSRRSGGPPMRWPGPGGTGHWATPRTHQRPNSLFPETRTGLCFCETVLGQAARRWRADVDDRAARMDMTTQEEKVWRILGATVILGGCEASSAK